MEINLHFEYKGVFLPLLLQSFHGVVVACLTSMLKVVSSNPIADFFPQSQIALFMQNLGLIEFRNS